MLVASLLLIFLSILYLKKENKYFKCFFYFLVLFLLWLTGAYFVSDVLTGNGIDESVLYHLRMGLTGAGFAEFKYIIFLTFIYLILTIFLAFFIFKFPNFLKFKQTYYLPIVLIVISYSINPGVKDLYGLVKISTLSASEVYNYPSDYISLIDIDIQNDKKNLVLIYLESLERTYLDATIFPDLLPNISYIEKNGLSFTNIDQLWGTSWTIAGMVASQCGIPLVTPSHGNSMSGTDVFLPSALCIGDVLNKNNYNLIYLGGADLNFAGKGNFLKSHGFSNIFGFDQLTNYLYDDNYVSSWGIYDDTLFSIAKKKFDYLSRLKNPFGLFMLTLDTHHPSGHIAISCADYPYENDNSNKILNAVHCADKLVYDFVEHIINSEAYSDTIIVLLSDHLAMRNTAWEQLNSANRKNLFIIIGEDINPKVIDKPGSLLDVTPTVLNTMGMPIEGLGFGRNLLIETPTFIELNERPNEYLQNNRNFFMTLWDFPRVNSNIFFNTEENSVFIGGRLYKYPALFLLDKDLYISEAHFEFFHELRSHRLHNKIFDLGYDQKFIWIDRCKYISGLLPNEVHYGDGFCAYFSTLGGYSFENYYLKENMIVRLADIKSHFTNIEIAENIKKNKLTRLSNYFNFGAKEVIIHESEDLELEGEFILVSSAYGSGRLSFGKNSKLSEKIRLRRGLTLLGLHPLFEPVQIGYIDTCHESANPKNNYDGYFSDLILKYSNFLSSFAIIAHDSALCGDYDLEPLFRNTRLNKWTEVEFRTPYIGIIDSKNNVIEHTDISESSISIFAKNISMSTKKPDNSFIDNRNTLPRVAHAGGGYKNQTYTNSIDALNYNLKYFNVFEIDFSWTSDNHLVCLHDWDVSFKNRFNTDPIGKTTLEQFKYFNKTKSDIDICTLDSLAEWMHLNKNTYIVIDIKEHNLIGLIEISKKYPELIDRFYPQIYHPSEYFAAKAHGYKNIIWTLYKYRGNDESVIYYAGIMDLFGVTMPKSRAENGLAQTLLDKTGVLSWVHTINTFEEYLSFKNLGVNQIYTDWLVD